MGIFSANFNKVGPGIPKDLPPKKGFALFASILQREFWNLIKLNLIFILFSLPIITIGSAYSAMTKVTTKMIWDKNVYVFTDFFDSFKSEFKRSFPTGIGLLAMMFLIFFSARFYFGASESNKIFFGIFIFLCVIAFMLCLALVFLFPLMVNINLPYIAMVKNSFLLGIVCIKHSLPCVLIKSILWFLMYLYFPLSVPILIFFSASFISLINSFAAWPGIQKYVAKDDESEELLEIE